MPTYVPILKAKPGEFEAFGTLSAATLQAVTPIFELCPDADLDKGVRNAVTKAKRYLPVGSRIAIDGSHINAFSPRPLLQNLTPMQWVARELETHGFIVMPVAPLLNGAAQAHAVAVAPTSGGVIIRVDARAVTAGAFGGYLTTVPAHTGLRPGATHVLLDFGAERDRSRLPALARHAHDLITEANRVASWASITVGAGAFPQSISNLPVGTPTHLDRVDAELWRTVAGAGHTVNFGDYGVNVPTMSTAGRSPLPNLRYLDGRRWLVWREQKTLPGNESFHDLCAQVVADPRWAGAAYSWGDQQIELAAARQRGAGTATQWRAFGTSHHITAVADRLTTLGEP